MVTHLAAWGRPFAVVVRDNASKTIMWLSGDFLVAGSIESPVQRVELLWRISLPAACFSLESEDKPLMEFGNYPLFILEFSYTSNGFCMTRVGQWSVFPVGLELDNLKIPAD